MNAAQWAALVVYCRYAAKHPEQSGLLWGDSHNGLDYGRGCAVSAGATILIDDDALLVAHYPKSGGTPAVTYLYAIPDGGECRCAALTHRKV